MGANQVHPNGEDIDGELLKKEKPQAVPVLPAKHGPVTRKVFEILREFPTYTPKQVAGALGRSEADVKTIFVSLGLRP
jgi:hypothetical protein